MEGSKKKALCLFDIDNTLAVPMLLVDEEMTELLLKLQKQVVIAAVGGSDFTKASRQLGPKCKPPNNPFPLHFQYFKFLITLSARMGLTLSKKEFFSNNEA